MRDFWALENIGIETPASHVGGVKKQIPSSFTYYSKFDNQRYCVASSWTSETIHIMEGASCQHAL